MECPPRSTSKDGYIGSEDTDTAHLENKSDQVVLRKHLHVRRQRAANACTECHSRKVRCDVSRFGLPCMNCRTDSKVCTIKESRRGAKSQKLESTQDTIHSDGDLCVKNASSQSYFWSNSRPISSCKPGERREKLLEYQHRVPWQLPSNPDAEDLRDACAALLLAAKQLLEKTQEFAASYQREDSISTPVGVPSFVYDIGQNSSPNSYGSLSQASSTPADCMLMWHDGADVLSLERWSGCDLRHPEDDADAQYALLGSASGDAGQLHDDVSWPEMQADDWPCFPG